MDISCLYIQLWSYTHFVLSEYLDCLSALVHNEWSLISRTPPTIYPPWGRNYKWSVSQNSGPARYNTYLNIVFVITLKLFYESKFLI